ncbi:MAG: NAD(P)-binding protein [Rhodocyclaceae bacterium]|nr:NAD(P)-binding protein [Rhodocyclaceae bacterium]
MTNRSPLVEVVGAGPAGLAAAITLARGGKRVVIHEAQQEVGHRFRRDLQGLENWSGHRDVLDLLRDLGLTTDFDMAPCVEATGFDAWDRPYPMRSSAPLLYLVERGPRNGSLDKALLDQALSFGVEIRYGSRKTLLDGPGIFASGPRAADAIAVGYHFETRLIDSVWVILDDELAPGGYAYLLAMGGRGTIKSCMFRDFGRSRLYAERTVERFRRLVDFDMKDSHFHGGAGNFRILPTAQPCQNPIAGEQAGFQDALAGFGMRYAMLSGVLAARSLLEGSVYDVSWQQDMKRPLETALVNRAIYDCLGNRGYHWLLRTQAWTRDTRGFLRWLYRSAIVRRLLLPWAQSRKPVRSDDRCFQPSCTCLKCRCTPCLCL